VDGRALMATTASVPCPSFRETGRTVQDCLYQRASQSAVSSNQAADHPLMRGMSDDRRALTTIHNGGTVRAAQIRGLITQRDEDPSHIKEPADQTPARVRAWGYKLAPQHPGLR
jgi:hypothetical protein